jgi:hypothetical protein
MPNATFSANFWSECAAKLWSEAERSADAEVKQARLALAGGCETLARYTASLEPELVRKKWCPGPSGRARIEFARVAGSLMHFPPSAIAKLHRYLVNG